MLQLIINRLNEIITVLVTELGTTYDKCENCMARRDGENCPAQIHLDEVYEKLKEYGLSNG